MKISDEHKFNLKCIAIALVCFSIDYFNKNGLWFVVGLWFVIVVCFGLIFLNYKANKK